MKLSRRDALAALAGVGAAGVVAGGASLADQEPPVVGSTGDGTDGVEDEFDADADVQATLSAVAEVLYPSTVSGHEPFVETYVLGRVEGRDEYRAGLVSAVTELDAVARDWLDAPYAALSEAERDRLLRDMGVDVADPDPGGSISSQLRHYVVNDLLYAFYTSPTGGALVGTENPTGHPGGIESYRQGPEALDDG